MFAVGSFLVLEMATFPVHLLQSVEKYGTAASPGDFKDICEKLCRKLVDDGPSKCKLFAFIKFGFKFAFSSPWTKCISVEESICSQVYWNAAAGVLVEAARRGLSVATLEELLPKNELSQAIINAFRV